MGEESAALAPISVDPFQQAIGEEGGSREGKFQPRHSDGEFPLPCHGLIINSLLNKTRMNQAR